MRLPPWVLQRPQPAVHGGSAQSNCGFAPARPSHSLGLPRPVMSETPRAYLPGLPPHEGGAAGGLKGEAAPLHFRLPAPPPAEDLGLQHLPSAELTTVSKTSLSSLQEAGSFRKPSV